MEIYKSDRSRGKMPEIEEASDAKVDQILDHSKFTDAFNQAVSDVLYFYPHNNKFGSNAVKSFFEALAKDRNFTIPQVFEENPSAYPLYMMLKKAHWGKNSATYPPNMKLIASVKKDGGYRIKTNPFGEEVVVANTFPDDPTQDRKVRQIRFRGLVHGREVHFSQAQDRPT